MFFCMRSHRDRQADNVKIIAPVAKFLVAYVLIRRMIASHRPEVGYQSLCDMSDRPCLSER